MIAPRPSRILLVTGMSGAGKSTALDTLEDLGWEVVDNLPLVLLDRLLGIEAPDGAPSQSAIDVRALAFGIDSRTRGFDADAIVARVAKISRSRDATILFLDCGEAELERRFSETRRRHPLALDRPAGDGIARERDLLAPLRLAADHLVDTTGYASNRLKAEVRDRFGDPTTNAPTLAVVSFGFMRGLPRNADLVFDMRFLHNPHWVGALRPLSGLDAPVAEYVCSDPSYEDAVARIEALVCLLLPRYAAEGKAYVTVAFGCTGGRHRSVHVAERVARRLREAGFSLTVDHRDLAIDLTRGPADTVVPEDRASEETDAHGGTRDEIAS